MAQNPGNKITKDTDSISAQEKRLLDALKKAQDNESDAIREFKQAQQDELSKIIRDSHRVEQYIKNNTRKIKEASEQGLSTDKLDAQLKKNQDELKRLYAQRENLTDRLEAAGRDDIVAAAESQAVDEEMVAEFQRRAKKVSALNKEYKRALRSGKSDAEIESIKKKLNTAEEEVKDPELLNKSNYGAPGAKNSFKLPGGFSQYDDTMQGVIEALAGNSKLRSRSENIGRQAMKSMQKKGLAPGDGAIGTLINIAGKILDVASAIRKPIDKFVDEAADILAANVGRINAALEGTGKTYADSTESMVEALGLNRFVRQGDYIRNIAELTSKGITYNVEQRAILQTIRDKTVASFSSMEGSLLRLVRLKQTDLTATQFGLEAALRNTLNRVFKDSTYLYDMYDSIAGAITDAVMISGNKDVTEYSSVIQTWMGAMYESGADSNMVTKIANALNALGSGNVSALTSDQDIQRLILLSMDTIGMDYADVLQQGLAPSDINDLLTAIVKYLVKIESNTKDNNVLQSSYTNLFGMSMSDLQAMKNLSSKMGSLTSVNAGSALAATNAEVKALETTSRTIVAEQVNNALANARFTFGNAIAKDASSYMSWKIANMTLDIVEQMVGSETGKKSAVGKLLKNTVGRAAQLVIFGNEVKGLISMFKALPSLFSSDTSGIQYLINGAPSYGGGTGGSTSAALTQTGSNFKTINTMSRITSHADYQTAYQSYSAKEWESDADEDNETLQLLESTLVQHNAEESKKAFATYLVGLTDDTLRSFASIFADEDAMSDTFEGNNNVLKDNLFKYADDTTSNSTAGANDAGDGADEPSELD